MKSERQKKILEIISRETIETQNQLIEALQRAGVRSTQATLSRDIRDMRLVKELGPKGNYRYVAASKQETPDLDIRLKKIFKECVVSCDIAQNIIVIKTLSGCANAAAEAIDTTNFPDIVGTIAGDNTIFMAISSREAVPSLMEQFHEMISK